MYGNPELAGRLLDVVHVKQCHIDTHGGVASGILAALDRPTGIGWFCELLYDMHPLYVLCYNNMVASVQLIGRKFRIYFAATVVVSMLLLGQICIAHVAVLAVWAADTYHSQRGVVCIGLTLTE